MTFIAGAYQTIILGDLSSSNNKFEKKNTQVAKLYLQTVKLSKKVACLVVPKILQALYPDNAGVFAAALAVTASVNRLTSAMLSFNWLYGVAFSKGILIKQFKNNSLCGSFSIPPLLLKSLMAVAVIFSWTGTTFLGNSIALLRKKYPEPESIG